MGVKRTNEIWRKRRGLGNKLSHIFDEEWLSKFKQKKTRAEVFVLVLCLTLSIVASSNLVHSQSSPSLAEYLNSWIANTTFDDSPLATQWGMVFGNKTTSNYDIAAQEAADAQRWTDVFLIKRSAEISNYTSPVLDTAVKTALQSCPKVGSLPATYYGFAWLVYHGFALWTPKWAAELGVPGWNATEMFNQLKYLTDFYGGGFLVAYDTYADGAYQRSTRYYDEQAEVLRAFVILARQGVYGAMDYADKIWRHLNSDGWWNGQWYWYKPSHHIFETEMGGFAMVISDYLGYVHPNIISDLHTKLLAEGWDSPCWQNNGSKYVLNHANLPDGKVITNGLRPWETLAAWRALHSVYPSMSTQDQNTVTAMLSSSAWYDAMMSGAFNDGTERRVTGAALMFLMGIIPQTGSLNLGYREEGYTTNTEIIKTNEFAFDYNDRRIRLSVFAGSLAFNFGTVPASHFFSETGIYDVYFSSDWNTVAGVDYLGVDTDTILVHPKAALTSEPLHLRVSMTVTFNATSSELGWNGTARPLIIGYRWDFGDGNITEGKYPTITHVYTQVGNKTVELTVTDEAGYTGYTQHTIEITYRSDLNLDGVVDVLDAIMLANVFGTKLGSPKWNPIADLNDDGSVDTADAVIFTSTYGSVV